jgi:hypothetical protein
VRRERDPVDRRKIFIALVPENVARIGKFYVHMQRAMQNVFRQLYRRRIAAAAGIRLEGYETMLAATEELKSMVEASNNEKAKAGRPRKPKQAR